MEPKRDGKLQLKFISGLLVMALVLIAALSAVIAREYRKSMENYYAKVAFDEAKIAAETINGDKIAEYASTLTKDDYYEQVRQMLLRVKQAVGLKYFYVVIPYENLMFYIWDAGGEGEAGVCDLGDSDNYYGGGQDVMRDAFLNSDGERHVLITDNDRYGYLASAYVAILDSGGKPVALSSVDMSMDMINEQINGLIVAIVLIIVGVLLIFVIGYFFFIRQTVLKPIYILGKAAKTIVREQMEDLAAFSVNVKTGDELESLADAFTRMAHELHAYILNLESVTTEKERISTELNIATDIQASMLPRIFPPFPERVEIDLFASMKPAKEVGGDFYDFFMDGNKLWCVMADVSGKGVPAALFMVIGKTLIKNAALSGKRPGEVAELVNNALCEDNETGLFITAFIACLDLNTGSFTYANAAHNPPLINKDGKWEYLKSADPAPPLALYGGLSYEEAGFTLEKGGKIFFYTDGVTEAFNADGEMYEEYRLLSAANATDTDNPKLFAETIKADLEVFVNGAEQSDDITVLALVYKGQVA
jgi:sigma-B regulation protein RsbU (phosphoserine phosphatase)